MYKELVIPQRTIMTPGPVEAEPRVLRIMSEPILGQYNPNFLQIMDETMELIRYIFQTKNNKAFTVDETARAGIEAMGLKVFGDKVNKMPTVTCVCIPEGIKEDEIRSGMLQDFGVEIAAAFGSLSGKIWRIGSMGYSSRKENVLRVLSALEATLIRKGAKINRGDALQAALDIYKI